MVHICYIYTGAKDHYNCGIHSLRHLYASPRCNLIHVHYFPLMQSYHTLFVHAGFNPFLVYVMEAWMITSIISTAEWVCVQCSVLVDVNTIQSNEAYCSLLTIKTVQKELCFETDIKGHDHVHSIYHCLIERVSMHCWLCHFLPQFWIHIYNDTCLLNSHYSSYILVGYIFGCTVMCGWAPEHATRCVHTSYIIIYYIMVMYSQHVRYKCVLW